MSGPAADAVDPAAPAREARTALEEYIALRMRRPQFANARSVRNALDRARLRQANGLFAGSPGASRATR
jgi:hypothetical protein